MPQTGSIGVSDADERRRWAKAFCVTEEVLMKAVRIVGTSIAELRKLFCQDAEK